MIFFEEKKTIFAAMKSFYIKKSYLVYINKYLKKNTFLICNSIYHFWKNNA